MRQKRPSFLEERKIFCAAIELSDLDQRTDYIRQACGGRTSMIERIGLLISTHEEASGLDAGPWFRESGSEVGCAWTPPSVNDLDDLFEDITVEAVIGKGGMGAVYRGRQESLDRTVAIKILPSEVAGDGGLSKRFRREAIAMGRLQHPNIVAIYDSGEVGGFYYLLMEYVHGTNVRELIKLGELDPESSTRIVTKICEALEHAHRSGYVHRDIKPENILVTDSGEVRVADFGLAKLVGLERQAEEFAQSNLTREGMMVGTPNYLAPEHVKQGRVADPRNDIFSLGVMFYEMLTGDLPKGHFPPPSKSRSVDVRLDSIVLKAMSLEPEQRYQTISNMSDDLILVTSSKAKRGMSSALGIIGIGLAALLIIAVFVEWSSKTPTISPKPSGSDVVVWEGWNADLPDPAIAPFDRAAAIAYQKAWAEHYGVPVDYQNSVGIRFSMVPAGEFLMGTDIAELRDLAQSDGVEGDWYAKELEMENPQIKVIITKPFAISSREITVDQYSRFVSATGHAGGGELGSKIRKGQEVIDLPVGDVSWHDAVAYCDWLSNKEGKTYQLPTEAMWEFACRAGSATSFCFGDDASGLSEYGWVLQDQCMPVGQKRANNFGIYDMHGNVGEWCLDALQYYSGNIRVDPYKSAGAKRMIRGGHFSEIPSMARSADRRL